MKPDTARAPRLPSFFHPLLLATFALLALPACESSDPEASSEAGAAGAGGSGPACKADEGTAQVTESPSCKPAPTDYTPRDASSANDTWAACVSDSGAYKPFNPSVGSNARAAAFEEIALRLGFGTDKAPSPQDFIDARVAYSTSEGLESRVVRREDLHYPAAPDACNKLSAEEQAKYPDRCAGPQKIQPILNAAFKDGAEGKEPRLNAARVEAALLWFLYIATFKEANSCAEVQEDCDSSTGYYAGTQVRESPQGLGRYVKARSEETHQRVWDGLLAVRCWRDLDNPSGPAMNGKLREQAAAQLDRALLRGVALIVEQRARSGSCDTAWETARILGPVLLREAKARDAAQAATLEAELGKSPGDGKLIADALEALFPCP